MLKKYIHYAALVPAFGGLVPQLDAHPVGAAILATTLVIIMAIDARASSRKKRR